MNSTLFSSWIQGNIKSSICFFRIQNLTNFQGYNTIFRSLICIYRYIEISTNVIYCSIMGSFCYFGQNVWQNKIYWGTISSTAKLLGISLKHSMHFHKWMINVTRYLITINNLFNSLKDCMPRGFLPLISLLAYFYRNAVTRVN